MPKVTYVHPDGSRDIADVSLGSSVMQGATAHRVRGILAECGGAAMCATCHVYVDVAHAGLFPSVTDAEDAMLDSTVCERRATSRLSCQLILSEEHNGLIVTLPESQV